MRRGGTPQAPQRPLPRPGGQRRRLPAANSARFLPRLRDCKHRPDNAGYLHPTHGDLQIARTGQSRKCVRDDGPSEICMRREAATSCGDHTINRMQDREGRKRKRKKLLIAFPSGSPTGDSFIFLKMSLRLRLRNTHIVWPPLCACKIVIMRNGSAMCARARVCD